MASKVTRPARSSGDRKQTVKAEPAVPPADEGKREAGKHDVVLVHGVTEDGRGLQVLRQRNDQVETGAIRPLEQGKPIQGEVVSLAPRKEHPLLCDVKVEVPALATEPRESRSHSGPAQVASDRYRRNWDAIWKNRDKRRLPN